MTLNKSPNLNIGREKVMQQTKIETRNRNGNLLKQNDENKILVVT